MTLRAGGVQIYGRGSLERRHGAGLEPLAQCGDALGVVGALTTPVEAAEIVISEAASGGEVFSGA